MLHTILLLLGLANPYFHVGDHICFEYQDDEFAPTKVYYNKVEKVGKHQYMLGSDDANNSRWSHWTHSIDSVDHLYHLCTAAELKEIQ